MFEGRTIRPARGWVERREQRHKVLIRTHMRAGARVLEVCVCDVSSQGICAMAASPPPPGTKVTLTDLAWPVVGKVMWSSHRRFGIAIGDRVDLKRLLLQSSAPAASPSGQTHGSSRKPEKSRETGQAMQFAFVAVAVGIAALLIGENVYSYLSQTADAVTNGLQPHQ